MKELNSGDGISHEVIMNDKIMEFCHYCLKGTSGSEEYQILNPMKVQKRKRLETNFSYEKKKTMRSCLKTKSDPTFFIQSDLQKRIGYSGKCET